MVSNPSRKNPKPIPVGLQIVSKMQPQLTIEAPATIFVRPRIAMRQTFQRLIDSMTDSYMASPRHKISFQGFGQECG